MSSRTPARALRTVLVCLAVLSMSGGAALAAEPTYSESSPEVLVPAPDAETLTTPPAPSEASSHAAPAPAEPRQAPAIDWLSTAMNAGAIAFCIWMLALLWRPGLGRSLLASRPRRG